MTWDMSEFGVRVEGIHPSAPKCGITVDGTFMEFDWDNESIVFSISRPTQHDLDMYDIYELNSPFPPKFKSLPMSELRKRFAYLSEDTIKHSVELCK